MSEISTRKQLTDEVRQRLLRLKNSKWALGQLDVFTEIKLKIQSSFLGRQKRQQAKVSYYVIGHNFPTTAHLSSFVGSHVNQNQTKNSVLKVKLFIYDCFAQVDIHIQISIPGQLQIRSYNLQGQPSIAKQQDYEKAYFSSVLRSLYPQYQPRMRIYNQVLKLQVLKDFIHNYVPYSYQNQLVISDTDLRPEINCGLELAFDFFLKIKSNALIKMFITQLKKINQDMGQFYQLKAQYHRQQYGAVIAKCSALLLQNSNLNQIKILQLKCLYKLKKYHQCKVLGEFLIHEGIISEDLWKILADSNLISKNEIYYLKTINTGLNISMQPQQTILSVLQKTTQQSVSKIFISKKGHKLSQYPEFCMEFTNVYFNKNEKYLAFKDAIFKANKERNLLNIIDKVDELLLDQNYLFDLVARLQKQKGWNKLVSLRSQCFWLESDFKNYQANLKKNISVFFLNQDSSISDLESKSGISKIGLESDLKEIKLEEFNKSFEGNFSQIDQQEQGSMPQIQPCSKRVSHKRLLSQTKVETKVLCNINLQKIFINLYECLKLQNYLERWSEKVNLDSSKENSKQKNEIHSIILIKKGFLHQKLYRKRKCEESFKSARKYSQSILINLVCCYSLALLYLQNQNAKGVEYYIIEVVKCLMEFGITNFDVIPEWATKFLPFIIQVHGKNIVNKVDGPLKQLIVLWLSIDYELKEKIKSTKKQ